MPFRIARFIRLSVLILALVTGAAAQEPPTVTITPESGEVESAVFTIEIDGVLPDTRYTVEILFEDQVVLSSEETSDQAGHIPYPISSTEGDEPGIYTLQVSLDGELIASGEFRLTEPAANDEPAERQYLGDLTVSPETAPFGKAHTLRVTELEPQAQYTVEITASETGQVAYRRSHTSDEDGLIEIEVFAVEGDAPGTQAAAIYDSGGKLIADGEFTIQPRPEREVSVTLIPAAVAAGGSVEISVSGLAAFDGVTAQISAADGVLIDTVLARAAGAGEAALSFMTPADLTDGFYHVDIFVEGDLLANAALRIGDIERAASDLSLSVEPKQGPIGARHAIAVAGLESGRSITLIILDPSGDEEYSATRQADAAGNIELTVSSTNEDETGAYTVEARADAGGELLASATFEITAAADQVVASLEDAPASAIPDASVSIEPQSAVIGSSHHITISSLRAHETVAIDVVFSGASVYTTEKTADASGIVNLELVTGEEDQPGDYTVKALRASGNQPSAILTATAKSASTLSSTLVADAEAVSGSLVAGSAALAFDGAAGQYVLITVASDDFDPAAALIDRDDVALAFNDDSRGQKDAIIGPLRLPYSGEYALAINAAPLMMPQGAETGDFTVTIEPVALMPIAFDADVSFALSAESPTIYYSLPVQTGDSLTVTVDSGGALDTLLQVVSPAGEEQAFDDDSGAGFDAELSNLIFDRAATYALVVSTFDGASGAGTINIARNPVRSLDDGDVTITLNDKAIRDLVVFDAAEDELLVLNLEVVDGDVEDLYVTATIDGMEVMSYSTMGVPDELPLAFVTPMSGRVVVTLEKFGYDDGIALDVSLERT
ncbi:MAG: hypothetical protein OXI30_04880 [Chloroflexota bacterium]|nr:hypothetical protein [Chloroflexota bacterium]